jgi:hypothetical protein
MKKKSLSLARGSANCPGRCERCGRLGLSGLAGAIGLVIDKGDREEDVLACWSLYGRAERLANTTGEFQQVYRF